MGIGFFDLSGSCLQDVKNVPAESLPYPQPGVIAAVFAVTISSQTAVSGAP
jgi:hypothetical protein